MAKCNCFDNLTAYLKREYGDEAEIEHGYGAWPAIPVRYKLRRADGEWYSHYRYTSVPMRCCPMCGALLPAPGPGEEEDR